MKKSFVFTYLVLSLFSIQAFGKVCNLEKGLNTKQLKSLKKARRIKRIGLNAGLLGKNVYKVDILSTDNDEQFLVLLGEAHIKGPRSAKIGAKVVKAFPLRMLEGVPRAEVVYMNENLPELSASIGWMRVAFSILSFNPFGSTISHAQKKGLTFFPGYEFYMVNKKRVKASKTESAQDVLANLQTINSDSSKKGLNLPLEVGEFLTPSSQDGYILVNRNLRMADNISEYLSSGQVKGTALAIVGAAHNPGLIELLKVQGFEACSNTK